MVDRTRGSEITVGLTRQRRRALARSRAKAARRAANGAVDRGGRRLSSAALALAGLGLGSAAHGATFTVTNLNDAGAGSLRQALLDANAAAGADVVDFQAGLTGMITLTTGEIAIADSVDIQGPGEGVLSVSGNDASRVFYLYNGTATLDVTISGLTITHGATPDFGAGIANVGEHLILDHITLTANSAGSFGGGLAATTDDSGTPFSVTVRDSHVTGNHSDEYGGGMAFCYTTGPVTVERTEISGNDAGYDGGGIDVGILLADMTITDSTIANNTASDYGGGLHLYGGYYEVGTLGNLSIQRSTISGNSATAGGGMYLGYVYEDFDFYAPPVGPVALENSTVSGNSAAFGSAIVFGYMYEGVEIHHTTITGNTGASEGMDLFAGSVNLENSIVTEDYYGYYGNFNTSFTWLPGDGDPVLGPLQDNGGPTLTHKPLPGSPVIDNGDPAFTPPPSTDQRGLARVVNGTTDQGAVEVSPGVIQFAVATDSVGEGDGMITITVIRVGGSDGELSANYHTVPGSATDGLDFTGTTGTVTFADNDATPQTFQVPILEDLLVEGDETFQAVLTEPLARAAVAGPQPRNVHAAALGSPTTEEVTIIDNDTLSVVAVPALGELGKLLLIGLLGGGGLLLIRGKKRAAATVVALTLTLGGVDAVAAGTRWARRAAAERQTARAEVGTVAERTARPRGAWRLAQRQALASALQQASIAGSSVTLRLADGTDVTVPFDAIRVRDRRNHGFRKRLGVEALRPGQAVVVRIARRADGSVLRALVVLHDSPQAARAALAARPAPHDR